MSLCGLLSSKRLLMYMDKQHEAYSARIPPHSQSQEVQSVHLNAASSMVPLVSMSSANNTFNKGKVSVRRPYISLWPSEDLVKDTSDRQELTPDVSVQTEPFTDADL